MKLFRLFFMMMVPVVLLVSSCIFRPIGKCTYDKNPPKEGAVTIVAIEEKKYGPDSLYLVRVAGFYNRTFRMKPGVFNACIKDRGRGVGSEMKAYVHSGGPCPPLFWLKDCRR